MANHHTWQWEHIMLLVMGVGFPQHQLSGLKIHYQMGGGPRKHHHNWAFSSLCYFAAVE